MKKLFSLLFVFASALLIAGCDNGGTDDPPQPPAPTGYTITVTAGQNGSAEASPERAEEGTIVTLTAMPAAGYVFNKWTVISGDVLLTDAMANPATFTMPAGSVAVKAEFVVKVDGNGFDLISDTNFKAYCEQFDTDGDRFLSQQEALAVTEIIIHGRDGRPDELDIYSLTGIEQFANLKVLDCARNLMNITETDLSRNAALEYLDCSYRQHVDGTLDLSGNPALKTLVCVQTFFVALDLSNCAALETLDFRINRVVELDLSDCISLKKVNCDYNASLSSLRLGNSPALKKLTCNETKVSELDLTNLPELTQLGVQNSGMSRLDLSRNAKLDTLLMSGLGFTTLDLTHNPELLWLTCAATDITELDFSKNRKLKGVSLTANLLTTLDFSNNPELLYVGCIGNQITELNVSQNNALQELYCNDNPISELDISYNSALQILICSRTNLSSTAIKRIFADLPPLNGKAGVCWVNNCPGSGHITATDKKVAEDKGWTLML